MADKKSPDEELRATPPAGAEGDAAPVEGAEGEKKGGLNAKKILLFAVLPIFLLAGIGGGLYFSGILDKYLPGKKKEVVKVETPTQAFFVQIPNMLVNLSSTDGQTRYLRLSVQLEVGSEADQKAVTDVLPRVIDQFQTYLRELRVKDLRGSAGIYRLQTELLSRVNAAAAPIQVKNVLFQEILIQ